jgi:hypothetical protein
LSEILALSLGKARRARRKEFIVSFGEPKIQHEKKR